MRQRIGVGLGLVGIGALVVWAAVSGPAGVEAAPRIAQTGAERSFEAEDSDKIEGLDEVEGLDEAAADRGEPKDPHAPRSASFDASKAPRGDEKADSVGDQPDQVPMEQPAAKPAREMEDKPEGTLENKQPEKKLASADRWRRRSSRPPQASSPSGAREEKEKREAAEQDGQGTPTGGSVGKTGAEPDSDQTTHPGPENPRATKEPRPTKGPHPTEESSSAQDAHPTKEALKDSARTKDPRPNKESRPAEDPDQPRDSDRTDKPGRTLPKPPERSKPSLSPGMITLRDHVRRALAYHFRQPVNTQDNTPAEILRFCLAFGCDTEVRYGSSAGNPMSGIGCLCYNYPCAGYQLLVLDGSRVMGRVGWGYQELPGQMLAMLAQSAVPLDYELRVGSWRGTVAELVESEKSGCVSGIDLSHKLIGLAHYLSDDPTWTSAAGEAWSLERMVQEELNRSPASNSPEATHHLMGLTYAVSRRVRKGAKLTGQYQRAEDFLARFEGYALGLQNPDGTWHPQFFAAKGASRDQAGVFRATGHILEWLVTRLPEERLHDRRVVASVTYVTAMLESPHLNFQVGSASGWELGAVMHALHALRIYDRRVFQPADPVKSPATEKPENSQARAAARPAAEP